MVLHVKIVCVFSASPCPEAVPQNTRSSKFQSPQKWSLVAPAGMPTVRFFWIFSATNDVRSIICIAMPFHKFVALLILPSFVLGVVWPRFGSYPVGVFIAKVLDGRSIFEQVVNLINHIIM